MAAVPRRERGWRFPVALDRTGAFATSTDEENIRQSIFVILGTAPGERIRRPDFGCDIHDLVFAPNHAGTATLAAHHVAAALRAWEPRIESVEAAAAPSADEPGRLDVHVSYVVRATAQPGALTFPFHLRDGDPAG